MRIHHILAILNNAGRASGANYYLARGIFFMDDKDLPVCHVVYACNDGYAIPMGVSLYSLFKNNASGKFCVHLFSEGISKEHKEQLARVAADAGKTLIIKEMPDLDAIVGTKLYVEPLSLSAYLRIFLCLLIEDEADRVLWLDGDTLVLGSIQELFDMDITQTAGAMALNMGVYNKRIHGFKKDEPYYNDGIFLINLKFWREHKVFEAILKEMRRRHGRAIDHDQDIINCILKGKITTLDPRFNFVVHYQIACNNYDDFLSHSGLKPMETYSLETLQTASKDIRIYHIMDPTFKSVKQKLVRPWFSNANHPISTLWYEYLDETPWRGTHFGPYTGKIALSERELHPPLLIRLKRKINSMLVYNVLLIRLVYVRIKYGFWH